MRKRPVAIAIPYEQSLLPAWKSARNFLLLVADKMYGTPERVRVTYACAVLLTLIAMIIGSGPSHAYSVCPA